VKADITRSTFRRDSHYSAVRLQQGRVQIDADFNEQVDIAGHRSRVTTRDVIGPSGVPESGGGFKLGVGALLEGVAARAARALAVGQRATVLASSDSGATWSASAAPGTADLHGVAIGDDTHAWAVGSGGTVLAGNPSTAAWSAQTSGTTVALRGVSARDPASVAAVGAQGTIIETSNGGGAWAAASISGVVAQDLYGVHVRAGGRGWAVGNAGRILARDPGSNNWAAQSVPAGFAADLRAVYFATDTHGWAVGRGAAILSTTNGGGTWVEQKAPLDVTATLRSVSADGGSVWAVGEDGVVIHSNDDVNWTIVAAPAGLDADLYGVAARSGQPALVVGDASTIGSAPAAGTLALVTPPAAAADLTISPGRMYVDGVLCENERTVRYSAQPDLPGAPAPGADGVRLAYLDVWQHHVTALEDPTLREVALGGPDTATRTKTVWQVRIADPADVPGSNCDALPPDWAPASLRSTGRMRAHTDPELAETNECMVPAAGGYRRLENQLYRVELHDAAAGLWKWSRDNGSVVARLKRLDPDTGTHATGKLTLTQPGRDAVTGFGGAEFVELTDEGRVLRGEHGVLLEVDPVDSQTLRWHSYAGPDADLDVLGENTLVRRWDGRATGVTAAAQVPLEGGIWVEFDAGKFQDGDYWTIPARTRTGQIEWADDDGEPRWVGRQGVEHRYAPLGFATLGGGRWSAPTDCRNVFPPLGNLVRMFMAGGDGQEAVPDPGNAQRVPLPQPIEVGVMKGNLAVVGASVRFSIVTWGGGGLGPGQDPSVTVPTDNNGIAACQWWLGPTEPSQQVLVELLRTPSGPVWQAPLHFDASLSTATEVAYDPSNCSRLAGKKTVQEAIDELCRETGGGGTCTVSVQPGEDLQQAVDSLPSDGGELCLAAGEWELGKALHIDGYSRVRITGRGTATVLRAAESEIAVLVRNCVDIAFRSLRIEGAGGVDPPDQTHLNGALTFRDCVDARVSECSISCRPASGRARTCVSFYGAPLPAPGKKPPAGGRADVGHADSRVRIERCSLEPGAFQTGLLIVDADEAVVDRNRVSVAPLAKEAEGKGGSRKPMRRAHRRLMAFQRDELTDVLARLAEGSETGSLVAPSPEADVDVEDQPTPLARRIVTEDELAGRDAARRLALRMTRGEARVSASADAIARRIRRRGQPRDKRAAAERLVDEMVASGGKDVPDEPARGVLEVWEELVTAGQGIVVAGDHCGTVQVLDNIVEDTIQGIHIGLSDRAREGRERGREVQLSRNVVHSLVPWTWERERHALFVGNVDSIAITDTRATLRRPLRGVLVEDEGGTPVDAIRIFGELGAYMVVRGSSIEGFRVGVHVVPTPNPERWPGEGPRERLWYVTETMALGAAEAVQAPLSVERGINAP
jgi:photosystem II stability/assembly factor-like uncharacterized protein